MARLVQGILNEDKVKVITTRNVNELHDKSVVVEVVLSILRKIPNSYVLRLNSRSFHFAVDGNPLTVGQMSLSNSVNKNTWGALVYGITSEHVKNSKEYIETTLPKKAVSTAVKAFKPVSVTEISPMLDMYNGLVRRHFDEQRMELQSHIKAIEEYGCNRNGYPLLEQLMYESKYQKLPVVQRYRKMLEVEERQEGEREPKPTALTVVAPVYYNATKDVKYLMFNTVTKEAWVPAAKLFVVGLKDEHPQLLAQETLPEYVQSAITLLAMVEDSYLEGVGGIPEDGIYVCEFHASEN